MVLLDFSPLAGWDTDYYSFGSRNCLVCCFLVLLSLSCVGFLSCVPELVLSQRFKGTPADFQGAHAFLTTHLLPPISPALSLILYLKIVAICPPQTLPLQLGKITMLCLGLLSDLQPGKCFWAIIWESYKTLLIHFPSFVDHSLVLSVVKCLKSTTLYRLI